MVPAGLMPATQARHLLERFSHGVNPALTKQMRTQGGPQAWFEWQLSPAAIPDAAADAYRLWFPLLDLSPTELWNQSEHGDNTSGEVSTQLLRWTLLRRMWSQRQVNEVMVGFWQDLLHVPSPEPKSWTHRARYDDTIRTYALSKFDALLLAAVTHPALGCFLDNAVSTKLEINENLGRELLELYTVGLQPGYTEDDVKNSARLLTGYRVDMYGSWTAYYSPQDHWTGPVQVLGFRHANGSQDGRAAVTAYIKYLARHPATAQRLARRLCQRFVSDAPSDTVVTAVANAYVAADTDIRQTLRALVAHAEFKGAVGAKVRTPVEDMLRMYRVLGIRPLEPSLPTDCVNRLDSQSFGMGQRPFDWPRPDGAPDVGDAWASVSRMLRSWTLHNYQSGRRGTLQGARYRNGADWLPPLPATVGEIIANASHRVLGEPPSPRLFNAIETRLRKPLGDMVHTMSDFGEFRVTAMLAGLLDSPQHMTR